MGLLDSAARRSQVSLYGREAYPTLDDKAAVLESIVGNHPLVDGHKRLGWLAVVVFYGLNGRLLEASDDAAYDLVIAVAGGTLDYHAVAEQLVDWH